MKPSLGRVAVSAFYPHCPCKTEKVESDDNWHGLTSSRRVWPNRLPLAQRPVPYGTVYFTANEQICQKLLSVSTRFAGQREAFYVPSKKVRIMRKKMPIMAK